MRVIKQSFQIIHYLIFMVGILFISACSNELNTPTPVATENVPTFNVQIPDKALLKNYLVVSLETEPNTTCELTYIAPKGQKLHMIETADKNGICEWRWKLEESDGRGHGRLIFTINGVSETHFIDIRPGF
ncbi:MAG TPA: hypothetical protein PLL95_04325 [Anaerolineales bacterium]|nr:hypothetical protein [Anaerolineales bacterium]HND47760.1 hypothetical protein [Anaerolineales bacterium]